MTVRDAQGTVTRIPVDTAPSHHYILGVDFQGDDVWVATAHGLSHGIRIKPKETGTK
jgi:ABC-type dipeptide/oligopeptide/nickel transport system permease subunit